MLMQVYMLARGRAAASPSPVVRTLAGRDEEAWKLAIREREIGVFWVRFYVAAVPDGFSRKLLALRIFRNAPTSMDVWRMAKACLSEFGAPRFLVTDYGCQFRAWLRRLVEKRGIALVKGRKRSCQFNGKAERFFKTLRVWQRFTLFAWKLDWIQRRLDVFRDWYNNQRPMWLHAGRTPDDMYNSVPKPEAFPARRCDPQIALCSVRRIHAGGDYHLPLLDIRYARRIKKTA